MAASSRSAAPENPELFSLVIGGYGMYGVILDVTLRVTRDELYEQRAVSMDYREFPAYFAQHIQTDPRRGAHAGAAVDRSRSRLLPARAGGGHLAARRARRDAAASRSPRRRHVLARPVLLRASRAASTGPSRCAGRCRRRSSWAPARLASSRATTRCGRRSHRSSCSTTTRGTTPTSSRSTTCRSTELRPVHGPVPRDPGRRAG